jgi:hypothetical protein
LQKIHAEIYCSVKLISGAKLTVNLSKTERNDHAAYSPGNVRTDIHNLHIRNDIYQLDSNYHNGCHLLQNILKNRLPLGARSADARPNRKYHHAVRPRLRRLAHSQRIALIASTAKQHPNIADAIPSASIHLNAHKKTAAGQYSLPRRFESKSIKA